MSQFFHKADNRLFEFIFEFILFFRALWFIGFRYRCPCCGWRIRAFTTGGLSMHTRDMGYCPRCNSKARHRRDWLYLHQHTNIFSDDLRLFHVSPKYSLARKLSKRKNIHYFGIDLSHRRHVSTFSDITVCPFKTEAFDAVICIHVLEEIQDDRNAMRELHRILKPGGWAFITVPIRVDEDTYEDPTITAPGDRELAFGEPAHVRIYGFDITQRLEESGFDVKIDYGKDINQNIKEKYGIIDDENIFLCTKY